MNAIGKKQASVTGAGIATLSISKCSLNCHYSGETLLANRWLGFENVIKLNSRFQENIKG